MPQMILRVVRPGKLEAPDVDYWEGPADLVAIEVGETGVEIEIDRKSFDDADTASRYMCSLLKRSAKTQSTI